MTALQSAEAHALLAAVRRDPDDHESWQVLADWLTEHDDARGQLVMLEQRLAHGGLAAYERPIAVAVPPPPR